MSNSVVGRVQDAQGLRGELYISLREAEAPWLGQLKTLCLHKADGSAVEFTVERTRPHKHGFVVKVKELSDRTAAEAWRGASFSIPAEFLVSRSGETLFLGEILHFELWQQSDGSAQRVGVIGGFSSNGVQDLLVVELEGETAARVEIPFVREFVVEMNWPERKIVMQMPPELIDPNFWRSGK